MFSFQVCSKHIHYHLFVVICMLLQVRPPEGYLRYKVIKVPFFNFCWKINYLVLQTRHSELQVTRERVISDLKASCERVGGLYSILLNRHGNVIDGQHYLAAARANIF